MTTLWDTTGTAIIKALAAERRNGGAVTSGNALTLVIVVDEADVAEVEAAVTIAASKHPMRMLLVIRRQIEAPVPRLDAEVLMGGRLGPGEAVVMRMYGRLALHAESVTLPLLAPDAPVVTWWFGAPPDRISYDPLGVFADRRITDVSRADDRVAALRQRASDFAPGDTDLAWTRVTGWRAALASAFDGTDDTAVAATVEGDDCDPSTLLLAGWLSSRLGFYVPVRKVAGRAISKVSIQLSAGTSINALLDGSRLVLRRDNQPESIAPFAERSLGELLAEELRRLDEDHVFAEALGAVCGVSGLQQRPRHRVHIWSDPAMADPPASVG
ncbi:glucose-6-phosphate dehydrogenase assembly protein OpcA [Jatrophihabitans sp. GAS493]|uniref:glucose-6-phosphate dehydrogenase assembly protein OpcA n=1 Tax=Jatrophihabitans sp. GAS493 TaxID=1907575 RepID=UPI000BC044FD|nr:glucose-6-phosphate dehydrogenase assembly protein OpcA [Jatrophihabitans sp. GAS493]SOD74007.1 glucose-6-phosphate dehydrogenase assembly protein OpcA [Jatrophihabitans sp. GAS493]